MAFVFTLTWLGALYGLALYLFGYAVILTVYRLWFSPLAAFPGPLLARTSFWYEFYYNWIRLGTYYLKVKEMHDMYGKWLLRAFSIHQSRSNCQQVQLFVSRQTKYMLPSRPSITLFSFLQPSEKQIIIQDSASGLALKVRIRRIFID